MADRYTAHLGRLLGMVGILQEADQIPLANNSIARGVDLLEELF